MMDHVDSHMDHHSRGRRRASGHHTLLRDLCHLLILADLSLLERVLGVFCYGQVRQLDRAKRFEVAGREGQRSSMMVCTCRPLVRRVVVEPVGLLPRQGVSSLEEVCRHVPDVGGGGPATVIRVHVWNWWTWR